jgi:hypothetical protein
MSSQSALKLQQSSLGGVLPECWKLVPDRAVTLQPDGAGVLRVSQGRVWVTSEGPHQGPANDWGDRGPAQRRTTPPVARASSRGRGLWRGGQRSGLLPLGAGRSCTIACAGRGLVAVAAARCGPGGRTAAVAGARARTGAVRVGEQSALRTAPRGGRLARCAGCRLARCGLLRRRPARLRRRQCGACGQRTLPGEPGPRGHRIRRIHRLVRRAVVVHAAVHQLVPLAHRVGEAGTAGASNCAGCPRPP